MPGTPNGATFAITNYTATDPTTYKSQIDANSSAMARVVDKFAPHPASPAAMSVVVDAGFIAAPQPNGQLSVTEVAQQSVTITAAPGSPNNRIDLIVVDSATGTAAAIAGTPAGSPSAPALPAGKLQVAQVSVPNGTTAIGESNITDLRTVWCPGIPGVPWAVASDTADAYTAAYTPANAAAYDGLLLAFRAPAANTTTTPTFAPDALAARTITKLGGQALLPNDIPGALAECLVRYNLANTRWELLNPAASSPFTTGDVKATFKTTADAGWVMMNDGTIGSAGSGATTLASATAQALFELLWTNISNSYCPVSGGRGASAAADWAANKTIQLPLMLGRAMAGAGAGSGLTSYALGQTTGENTHTLTTAEMPSHTHPSGIWDNQGSSNVVFATYNPSSPAGGTEQTTGSTGGGGAHNNMQPTTFLNVMIKL